jgi:hypothetical protein
MGNSRYWEKYSLSSLSPIWRVTGSKFQLIWNRFHKSTLELPTLNSFCRSTLVFFGKWVDLSATEPKRATTQCFLYYFLDHLSQNPPTSTDRIEKRKIYCGRLLVHCLREESLNPSRSRIWFLFKVRRRNQELKYSEGTWFIRPTSFVDIYFRLIISP